MQLQWTEPAAQDLDKIEEYISRENSPTVAIDIVLNVIETVEMVLPTHPRAGRMGRVTGTREFVVEGVPFVVIYREIDSDQLQIIRVLVMTELQCRSTRHSESRWTSMWCGGF